MNFSVRLLHKTKMFAEGAFLLFHEEAYGCSCYSYKAEDYNMPEDIAGDELLKTLDFEQASRRAAATIRSMDDLGRVLEEDYETPCGEDFLREHIKAENATGPSRLVAEETIDRASTPYETNDVTFQIYWMRFDHVPPPRTDAVDVRA